jgi:ABC-2 type transport system permease protein
MWRAYVGVVKKEFIQGLRDRNTLRMLFVMPVLQLLLLGYAIQTDVKHLWLDVYDFDRSELSRRLIASLQAGEYFQVSDREAAGDPLPLWQLDQRFKEGRAEMALIIPRDFARTLETQQPVTVGWIADGTDANAARTGIGYAGQILRQFSSNVTGRRPYLQIRSEFRYNPEAESRHFMVPGVVATLLTMLTLMMTSMAIVRERELGTLEQILVTPVSSVTLLFGKLTTFTILAMLIMGISLNLGIWWFHVPFVGSPWLLVAVSLLYLLTTLGIGMFVSTIASTQQQAMFYAWFFSIFTMLTSGYFTPVSNMPMWLQRITLVNPMRYFMDIIRGIMMKGANAMDMHLNILALAIFGVVIFTFSVLRFHKRTA